MKKLSYFKIAAFCLTFTLSILFPISSMNANDNVIIASASEIQDDTNLTKAKLNVKSLSLVKEDSYILKVYRTSDTQKVTFKSSDTDIVTLKKTDDKVAEVRGVKVGEATITVTIKEGFKTIATLKCSITVTPPAACITFTENHITLKIGESISLKKEMKPATPYPTAEMPVFTVTNSKVATVSSSGTVTALSSGKTVVYVTIANGDYDTCTITVLDEIITEPTHDPVNTKDAMPIR